jgi:hypothetical protein
MTDSSIVKVLAVDVLGVAIVVILFDLGLGMIRMMAIILVIVLGIMLTPQPIFLAVVVTTIISIALLGWKKGEVKNGS